MRSSHRRVVVAAAIWLISLVWFVRDSRVGFDSFLLPELLLAVQPTAEKTNTNTNKAALELHKQPWPDNCSSIGGARGTQGVEPKDADAVTIGAACRCLSSLGSSSSPSTSLWNHPSTQNAILSAARRSLHDCWNWEGAIASGPNWGGTGNATVTIAKYSNETRELLAVLHGSKMRRFVKTRPSSYEMERIAEVLARRLSDPANHPPLKIAVFGGSVTFGTDCMGNDIGLRPSGRGEHGCAWPGKLERALNGILGGLMRETTRSNTRPLHSREEGGPAGNNDTTTSSGTDNAQPKVVTVRNFAVAGTDSDIGSAILEFDLLNSPSADNPLHDYDVIISSFGANDAQAPLGSRDNLFGKMQKFVRLAKSQRPCDDLPLVVMLDDVPMDTLGDVRGGLRYGREMAEAAQRAGVMSVSYADLVREEAYDGPNGGRDSILARGTFGMLHPGMLFHTGVAWSVGHALLEGMMVEGCDASSWPDHGGKEPRGGFVPPAVRGGVSPTAELKRYAAARREHEAICGGNDEDGSSDSTNDATAAGTTSCAYSWLANSFGASSAEKVNAAVRRVATVVDGWEATGYPVRKPRRTWQASKQNATFAIQLDRLDAPINRMLILYIKSYGTKWEQSLLEVTVEGKTHAAGSWEALTRFTLSGLHGAETSINYSHHVDLGEYFPSTAMPPGSAVRATFVLVGGSVFQINGLALCRSSTPFEGADEGTDS